MISREMLDAFFVELDRVLDAEYAGLAPMDPPPWQEGLRAGGYALQDLEHACYVLACLADECVGGDPMGWSLESAGGWMWLLFHESMAGERYFERFEECQRQKDFCSLLYWVGIRAGFQGRFVGDPERLLAWLVAHGSGDLSEEYPFLVPLTRVEDCTRAPRRMHWWLPLSCLALTLLAYGFLAHWAVGMR